MEKRAIMLVYLSESKRRRKDKGMTTSLDMLAHGSVVRLYGAYMNAVIQNCLSNKNTMCAAPGAKPLTTPGIKSPMMIR